MNQFFERLSDVIGGAVLTLMCGEEGYSYYSTNQQEWLKRKEKTYLLLVFLWLLLLVFPHSSPWFSLITTLLFVDFLLIRSVFLRKEVKEARRKKAKSDNAVIRAGEESKKSYGVDQTTLLYQAELIRVVPISSSTIRCPSCKTVQRSDRLICQKCGKRFIIVNEIEAKQASDDKSIENDSPEEAEETIRASQPDYEPEGRIVCPNCHAIQRGNRKLCMMCGFVFGEKSQAVFDVSAH